MMLHNAYVLRLYCWV